MPKRGKKSPRDERLWDDATHIVRQMNKKSSENFNPKDWGFVQHIYHKKKYSVINELLTRPTNELVDRVAASSAWSVTVGQVKERLFNLYDEYNSQMKKATSNNREEYVRAYYHLMENSQHGGLLRGDEGSFEEFLEGYREIYEA